MPVYKKGQKWRVVIWNANRRHDFILSGTKAEALEFESRKRVELLSSDPQALLRDAPSFSDFVEGPYRTHAKAHLKARTWSNRTYTIATLSDHFRDVKMSRIHVATIEAYKAKRIEAKIKASTINDDLKVLRAIFAYAKELGVPLQVLKFKNLPTRGVKRKVTAWTHAQVALLMEKLAELSPDILPLVVFLLNTGCRKGEALALEWRNVDSKRRLIKIEPSEEWQPKDGEAREIPISDKLAPFLVHHHAEQRYVFPSTDGGRYAFWPQRAFDRARSAAGLKGGPHTCRHTFATHFLMRCPDIHLLAKILGHSTAKVTELYAHLLPDHLERARNVVNFGTGLTVAAKAVG